MALRSGYISSAFSALAFASLKLALSVFVPRIVNLPAFTSPPPEPSVFFLHETDGIAPRSTQRMASGFFMAEVKVVPPRHTWIGGGRKVRSACDCRIREPRSGAM